MTLMCLPIGLVPAKYRLAMDSLMIASSGLACVSRLLKSRPKSSFVSNVLKKPGATVFKYTVGFSPGGSVYPSAVMFSNQQQSAMGVIAERLADCTPGVRARFSCNCEYSRANGSPGNPAVRGSMDATYRLCLS